MGVKVPEWLGGGEKSGGGLKPVALGVEEEASTFLSQSPAMEMRYDVEYQEYLLQIRGRRGGVAGELLSRV